ncbi:MAG: sulfite exporter TauE/SafE family protein [Desulfurococcales archaeon]|nr:sulfite exporter TauE/SafE family protein [Desulfurococcales archaeon]
MALSGVELVLLSVGLGIGAGFLATLLGIGGGAVIVPLLVMAGVDIKVAAPASLVAILGTSSGGLRYLHGKGLVDVRVALILETATATGAVLGVWLFGRLRSSGLLALFSLVLFLSAIGLYLRERRAEKGDGSYRWPPSPVRLTTALLASLGAGLLSAMLGIGGGVIKVPILVLVLGLPIKMAVATSKLMVGITALVGVVGHTLKGNVNWILAIPLAVGTYTGATVSSRVLVRLRSRHLYLLAIAYYIVTALYLLEKSGLLG